MNLNLTIRKKLIGSFGLLVMMTTVVTTLAWVQTTTLQDTIRQTQGKEALLGRAESAIWELRWTLAQYLLLTDSDSRKKILDGEQRLYDLVNKDLSTFHDAPGLSDEEIEGEKAVLEGFTKYAASRPRFFQLVAENKMDEAAEWRAQNTTKFGGETNKALASLREITVKNDLARTEKENVAAENMKLILALLGLATAVTGIAAGFYVFNGISTPLSKLQVAISKVREGGNVDALAEFEGDDEIAAMGQSVNLLLSDQIAARKKADIERQNAETENNNLNNSVISLLQAVDKLSRKDLTSRAPVTQDIIGTVSDSINQLTDETAKVLRGVIMIASQVAQASNKVQSQGELVSKTAQDERKNVGEMIISLDDATQSMNQVAVLADQSNRSAERATLATDTALATVNNTVKGMESIRETISETEKRIKRLGERSQEISGIVNLINTISERTHVLALNASMQAAVAGEAGRGFAVVAEEVQRLAESSRNATQQISTLVNNIQLETNETISTVNRTIGQVVQGSEFAQKAGEQMRITQAITGELVEQVRRITEASNEQKGMSAKLLLSVQHLGESNERTAEQIDTQSQETQTLLNSAQQLVESVKVFTLPKLA